MNWIFIRGHPSGHIYLLKHWNIWSRDWITFINYRQKHYLINLNDNNNMIISIFIDKFIQQAYTLQSIKHFLYNISKLYCWDQLPELAVLISWPGPIIYVHCTLMSVTWAEIVPRCYFLPASYTNFPSKV